MNPFKLEFTLIKTEEPLKNHCTYHIGGSASFFYELTDIKELPEIIKTAKKNKLKYLIIGSGSNTLFPDKGYKGLIIKIKASDIKITDNQINADAGAKLSEIIIKVKEHNLKGLEPLTGIPGTIGGAIYGNAGAYGIEICDFIEKITVFDPTVMTLNNRTKKKAGFSYRKSIFKQNNEIILSAAFKLKKSSKSEIEESMNKILEERKARVVPGFSCGSFFINPDTENKAGYLIDKAGLKGLQVGQAQVSHKNANYLINLGNATQKDILKLADIIKKTVKKKFGITLKEEVNIIR